VWWLRLGIAIERISPAIRSRTAGTSAASNAEEGSDQAAGQKLPAAAGQVRCFIHDYTTTPHQALNMSTGELYSISPRPIAACPSSNILP